MAKKITETGPKPLRGIRNPDLYITKNNPVDASFSDIERQSIKDAANRARIRNYNTQHGHIGYDELRDTSVITPQYNNLDYGKSSYDKGVLVNPDATDVQNIRADRQPWYAKIASGLGKAITTTGTTFIDNTLGLVVGAAQGIANLTDDNPDTGFINGIVDNPVTRAMKSFSDYTEEIMPNYYSEDEQEHPFRHLLSANFIGDKMIKNLGFVVGSIYSGGGWGSLTRGGLTALGKATLKGASKFTNPTWISASNKLAKGIFKSTPTISSAVATFTGAVGESSLEALSAQQEFEEQNLQVLQQDYETKIAQLDYLLQTGQISQAEYNNQGERLRDAKINTEARIKKDALGVANVTFGMNMPVIWAADAMWLGKMFAKGFSSTSKAVVPKPKAIIGNLKEGYSTKFSNVKDAFNVAKGPLGEGAQEFLQSVSADTAKDMYGNDVTEYYAAALDGKAHKENLNFIGSLGKAMAENLGSENAWEEFLIGSLTSLIGAPKVGVKTKADGSKGLSFEMAGNIFSEIKGINEDRNATREAVEAINNRLSDPKFSEYWNTLVRHNSLEKVMSEAASTGDKFTFKNAEATQTNSDIELFRKIGRLNDLKTFINESTDIDEAGAEQLISMFDKQVESEDNKTTIANLENGLKDAEELLIALRNEEEAIKKELEDESDNLWANRDNLDVVDAYEKLEETLKENRNRQDEVSKEIQRFNNRLAFGKNSKTTNPYTDEHGNRLSLEEIQKKLQTNAKELVNHIESYETEAELINSLTHNALSAEGVAFLTNMSMLNKDAAERIHSIFKNELAELNSVRDKIVDEIYPMLEKEDAKIDNPKKTRKGLDAILEIISGVDNPNNRAKSIAALRANPTLLDSIKTIVRESDEVFPDSRVSMLTALDDAIKLLNRVEEISSSLDWYLQSNERVEQHLKDDLDTALAARKEEVITDAVDKLNNAQTRQEADDSLEHLTTEERKQAIREAKKKNKKLDDWEDIDNIKAAALDHLSDNEEFDESTVEAAASLIANSELDSREDIENFIASDKVEKVIAENSTASSIYDLEDKAANIRTLMRAAFDAAIEDKVESSTLDTGVEVDEDSLDEDIISGTDGPSRNDGEAIVPITGITATSTPITDSAIEANDDIKLPKDVVDKNLYIRCTRHIWSGQTTPSTFNRMVDAQNYSKSYKDKIKTVHDYLKKNGAYEYIESGKLSTKDTIYYVVDPELTIEDKSIVLMAVKTSDGKYQVVGDVAHPYWDKRIVETSPNLKNLHDKILAEYRVRKNKDGIFESSFTTHANKIYIGTPEFTNTEVTVSSLANGIIPNIGFINRDTVVSKQSIARSNIFKPINLIDGATVVLVPNGRVNTNVNGYSIVYAKNLKLSDYTGNNGLQSIITNSLNKIAEAKDFNTVFKEFLTIKDFVHVDLHGDDLNNGNYQIRVDDKRIILTGTKEERLAILERELMPILNNSYVQIKSKFLGTKININNTEIPYESVVANYLTVNLGNEFGIKHTVGDWFSVNPADINGKEVKASPIRTTNDNPSRTKIRTVSYNDKSYEVDLRANKVIDGQDLSPKDTDIIIADAWCSYTYGNRTNGRNIYNNVAQLPDGRWYDRNNQKFTTNPLEEQQKRDRKAAEAQKRAKEAEERRKREEAEVVHNKEIADIMNTPIQGKEDIDAIDSKRKSITKIEDIIDDIQANEKGLTLTKDEKYYQDKWGNLYIRVTSAIKVPGDTFDKNNPYYTPSTTLGNVVHSLAEMVFLHTIENITESELLIKYPNLNKQDLRSIIKSLSQLRNKLEHKGYKFKLSEVPLSGIIIDKLGNTVRVAGSVDLMAYDDKGNFHIFDFKTIRTPNKGTVQDKIKDNTPKWTDQTNVYRLLLEQSYKVKVNSLTIIPIEVRYPTPNDKNNYSSTKGRLLLNNQIYSDTRPILHKEESMDIDDTLKTEIFNPKKTRVQITPEENEDLIKGGLDIEAAKNSAGISSVNELDRGDGSGERNISGLGKPISHSNTKTDIEDSDDIDDNEFDIFDDINNSRKSTNSTSTSNTPNIQNDEESDSSSPDIDDFNFRETQPDNTTIWDESTEISWLNEALPQLNTEERLSIVDGLIKAANTSTGYAYGRFKNGVIDIANNAARGTLYHEAFHSVYHTLLNPEEKSTVMALAKKKWGNKSNLELEELLAEDFREYTEGLTYSSPFVRFFRKLWNIIKTLGGRTYTLDSIYYRVNNGYFKNRIVNSTSNSRLSIAETNEMKSIRDKAIKDGTFMKAPNGKATNLNERQWLQVRTTAFKKWFGNWEIVDSFNKLLNNDFTFNLEAHNDEYHNYSIGAKVNAENPLDNLCIGTSAYCIGILENLGFKPHRISFIAESPVMNTGISHKVALFKYNDKLYIYDMPQTEFIFKTDKTFGNNNQYHEGIITNNYKPRLIELTEENLINDYGTSVEEAKRVIEDQIDNNWKDSNEASKVVDENGEPLVVYHGTMESGFYTFDTNINPYRKGTYFVNNKFVSEGYGDIYPSFLNIRNPKIVDFEGSNWNNNEKYGNTDKVVRETDSAIYDGTIIQNVTDSGGNKGKGNDIDFIIFEPNQIKSATENNGNFSTENNDIRYREAQSLSEDSYSAIQEYYNEKTYYDNLNKEDKNFLKEVGISIEEWNSLPKEIRESKLHCRR